VEVAALKVRLAKPFKPFQITRTETLNFYRKDSEVILLTDGQEQAQEAEDEDEATEGGGSEDAVNFDL
jgi:hypothetical protein